LISASDIEYAEESADLEAKWEKLIGELVAEFELVKSELSKF
jgi:hypothetical protein